MARLVFKEFDQFVESLSGLQGQYVLRSKQVRDWRLRSVDLDGVQLMMGQEGAARVYNGKAQEGYFHIYLLLSRDRSVVVDGQPFDRSQIAWIAPGKVFHTKTDGPIRWLDVAVSKNFGSRHIAARADEIDFSLLGRNVLSTVRQSPAPLIRLAHRLFRVDAQAPEALHTPAAEHAARMEVLDVVFRTVLPFKARAGTQRHSEDRKQMLQRGLELLETLEDTSICTADLCEAVGASERTVRNLFNDYFGMSPHRYLMTRRLHAIRSAIRHAARADTVTSICARYGVWDFGRFAKQYRERFGTLPSQSLYGPKRWRSDQLPATSSY